MGAPAVSGIGRLARRGLDGVLVRSPLQALFHRRRPPGPAVLAYHDVSAPGRFAEQLDVLVRHHQPVTPSDIARSLEAGAPLPPRAVLITFDDAGPSLLRHALPLLRERGLQAVAFAVAGLVGTDTPFWWEEAEALQRSGGRTAEVFGARTPQELVRALKRLPDEARERALRELRASSAEPAPKADHLGPEDLRTLDADGIEIGSHSLTHPVLSRCSPEKVRAEVAGAHERLAEILERPPRFFAYPNGNHDPGAEEAFRTLGYRGSFLFDHRRPVWPPPDPLRISRLRVGAETSLDRFRLILSGLHPAIHHLLGRP